VISDHELVLAAAAAYDPAGKPSYEAVDGALRMFTTKVRDVTVYSIEGTHDPITAALDFMAIPTEEHEVGEHDSLGFVHAGFYSSALELLPGLRSVGLIEPFALTGHSLGAAVALFIAGMLIDRGYPPVKIGAFAPPRVGGAKFVSIVTSVPFCAYRFGDDPVTEVPLTLLDFPYQQIPLTAIGRPMSPSVSCHHVGNYVTAVPVQQQE
jgi:hypothetical protein